MRRLAFLLFAFNLLGFLAGASHIVGGTLTYEHLGGSSFKVILRLYKDCGPSSIDFPPDATVAIRYGDGSAPLWSDDALDVVLPLVGIDTLNPQIDPCSVNPGICVSEAIFSKVISLPPRAGGYHLIHQQFARNASLDNVTVPGSTGESFNTYIPDISTLITNSSPSFTNFPPVFVCRNQPLDFDFSASDPDGDSLVYSLYHPYDGRRKGVDADYNVLFPNITTTPSPPDNITFTPIGYQAGYSYIDPLNAQAGAAGDLSITQNGLLQGTPTLTGQFVVGVMVEEYRDGVKIGEIVRDFQFNVVNCPPPVTAVINPVDGCAGTNINFSNGSFGGPTSFEWDFGDGTPISTATNPSHNYPAQSNYTVQLIADPGSTCADTAYYTLQLASATADFTSADSICETNGFNFFDASSAVNTTVNSWTWDFGDGNNSSSQNASHSYAAPGTYTVQLDVNTAAGCTDSYTMDVYVQDQPVSVAGSDQSICEVATTQVTLSGSISGATGGIWSGPGGSFSPSNTDLNATYTPTAAELSAGSSMLILNTSGNGFCTGTQDTVLITYLSGPQVDAGADHLVCADTGYIPLNATFSNATGIQWSNSGFGYFDDDLSAATNYNINSADTAGGSVWVYIQTTGGVGCPDVMDSMEVVFYPAPVVSITSAAFVCTGQTLSISSSSSTGSGYWETLGDGAILPNTTSFNVDYTPGPGDASAGSVDLVFHSTNSPGCQTARDTFNLSVLPAPQPNFAVNVGCLGQATVFTDISTSSDPITNWDWDFDDGNTATTQNSSNTFATLGVYDVVLTVTTSNGCSASNTIPVQVANVSPNFVVSSDSLCVTGNFIFTDASSTTNANITGWDWDFGDANTGSSPSVSHNYSIGGDFTVQLIVYTDAGCIDTVTQDVYAQPLPMVSVGPDTTACDNNPDINLAGLVTGASGGNWTGSGGAFTPGSSFLNTNYAPTATEINSGSSQLILSSVGNGLCPSQRDTLTITYVPGPVVDAGLDLQVCETAPTADLNGIATNANGVEWTTSGIGGFVDSSMLSATYNVDPSDVAAGSIWMYLTSTNNGMCFAAMDSMEITFFPPPTVNLTADDTICSNNDVVLTSNSSTGNGYWETLGDGLFTPDTAAVSSYMPGTGDETSGMVTLIFHSLDNGGCAQVVDTLDLVVIPAPSPDFSATVDCFEVATVFTDNSTSVDAIVSWLWDYGDGTTETMQNPIYTFTTSGMHDVTLTVTSSNGCVDSITKAVEVYDKPVALFALGLPCVNGGTAFYDSSTVQGATISGWSWSFGDAGTSTLEDPVHQYATGGTYTVELIVTSDQGCMDTIVQNVDIHNGPDAAFSVAPDIYNFLYDDYSFMDNSTGDDPVVDWYWEFGDTNGVSTDQNPVYAYDETGEKIVTLIVTDQFGCSDTAVSSVFVQMPPLLPNAFSPNGDASNNVLFVKGGPYKELSFEIFNNWGEVIFSTDDSTIGWDGTFKGEEQPVGVYVYRIKAITPDDKEHLIEGDVTLLR